MSSNENMTLRFRDDLKTHENARLPGSTKSVQEEALSVAKGAIRDAFRAGVNPFGILSEMEFICQEVGDENYKQRTLWAERRVCVLAASKAYQAKRAATFTPSSTLGLRR